MEQEREEKISSENEPPYLSLSRFTNPAEVKKELEGKEVWMKGWLQDVRNLGSIAFLLMRDNFMLYQATIIKKMNKSLFKEVTSIPRESVLAVKGTLQFSEKVMNGFEILVNDCRFISRAQVPLPLGVADKVDADMDTRFDNRFLDLRKPEISAIFRIRSTLLQAIRDTLLKEGFLEVHTPKIVATATEGGTELFPMEYFEKDAYLNQSPQLYKQMLMATGFDKVFEIAPAFRAEKHHTSHHLNEFISVDVEVAFAEMSDVTSLLEKVIKNIYKEVLNKNEKEIETLKLHREEIEDVSSASFPNITYTECLDILQKKGFKIEWGEDLSAEATKIVAKEIASNVGADLRVCPRVNTQVDPYGLNKIAETKGWGDYLIDNAMVALKALDILDIPYNVNDLLSLELFGRFYALTQNIRIDVGHNPLAAKVIEKALHEKVVLIYNSLDDKDYKEVLRLLKPKVKRVEIIEIDSQRATTLSEIEKALKKVGLEYSYFENKIDANENYLVFGSFCVVEEFLKQVG
ncbi:MAG TPA: aspartate--tRNA(Asn) ligase, partial [Thermoplasmata archaeon]|nr:aspartate--tRNA(Asn) ligase [Thermoplasmata archaeon]